jgi:competence protein ComEA
MSPDTLNRFWLLATFFLILLIVVSSLIIWNHRDNGQQIFITDPQQPSALNGYISIDGAVINPGTYTLKPEDTIEDIIQSAGGTTTEADLSGMQLIIPNNNANLQSQKIDINRADVWLLQALPDIGEVRAEAIVEYRSRNGYFKTLSDIGNVPGIGQSTFEKIKPLITVSEN